MGMRGTLFVMGLCMLSQGCSMYASVARNLVTNPAHYWRFCDEAKHCYRNKLWAETIWEDIAYANHEMPFSEDYADGFVEGFADYLKRGGTGESPPLPPRKYWRLKYQTPVGHQAIEEWYAGFRHGAAVARDNGYRRWTVIPSSMPYSARHRAPFTTGSPATSMDMSDQPARADNRGRPPRDAVETVRFEEASDPLLMPISDLEAVREEPMVSEFDYPETREFLPEPEPFPERADGPVRAPTRTEPEAFDEQRELERMLYPTPSPRSRVGSEPTERPIPRRRSSLDY